MASFENRSRYVVQVKYRARHQRGSAHSRCCTRRRPITLEADRPISPKTNDTQLSFLTNRYNCHLPAGGKERYKDSVEARCGLF